MIIKCLVPGFRQVTGEQFVRFWEQLYDGYDESFYRDNIEQPLTEERIKGWFVWKNRTPLSAQKIETIRRYFLPDNERTSRDADTGSLTAFLNRPGGAIWRIFWLHLQHPHHFPIYDQHVHRAMAFMLEWPESDREIPALNLKKINMYLEEYRPFFDRFDDCEYRQVDRALWSFGRFLKNYRRAITLPPND